MILQGMGGAGQNSEQRTNCRRFDDTPGTRKHRATELFNERHGLLAHSS